MELTIPIITLSPAFPEIIEGNSGSKLLTMTVTLSAAATSTVIVDYSTNSGFATAGSDFTQTNGKLTFAVGEISKTFTIPIIGDLLFEGDESFFVDLRNPTGAVLGTNGSASAIAIIRNDDLPPGTGLSVKGTSENDLLVSSPGNETIDGGSGIDTVVYADARTSFSLLKSSTGFTIADSFGNQGADTLLNVERLKFSSGNVALDVTGSAGTVAKIIGSVFGAGVVKSRPDYVGIGLSYIDGGMTYEVLAALAIGATGAATSQQIVNLLWKNVVGTNATTADAQPFIDMLTNGMGVGALGVLASETDLNKANINLVGLALTGIDYI